MPFSIDDAKSFEANMAAFVDALAADEPLLAGVLRSELPRLSRGEIAVSDLWNTLHSATSGGQPS